MNWRDEQMGWTLGTGWEMGGGCVDEDMVDNGNVDNNKG